MLSVAASGSKEGTQLQGRCPTPPHPTASETMPCWLWQHVCRGGNAAAPTASEDDAMLSVALGNDAMQSAQILVAKWRGFWFPNRADFGCGIVLFWLRNRLFLIAESSVFGCGSVFFWLRKRLFLVAEAYLILVAESSKFGCGSVEIWLRNRTLFYDHNRSHSLWVIVCEKMTNPWKNIAKSESLQAVVMRDVLASSSPVISTVSVYDECIARSHTFDLYVFHVT